MLANWPANWARTLFIATLEVIKGTYLSEFALNIHQARALVEICDMTVKQDDWGRQERSILGGLNTNFGFTVVSCWKGRGTPAIDKSADSFLT